MLRRARGLPGLVAALLLAACGKEKCANEAFFGLPSPDGAFMAFVFHRRCGEPLTTTTEVSVLNFPGPLKNDAGNVLTVAREQPVRVTWVGPKRLLVTGFTAPVRQQAAVVTSRGGVDVQFEAPAKP